VGHYCKLVRLVIISSPCPVHNPLYPLHHLQMAVCLESLGKNRKLLQCMFFICNAALSLMFMFRRSHLPEVIKTKNWEHRMEKEKKARAIKMLQAELKDEKQADMQRRREITRERKRAADERRRVEEEKTKVLVFSSILSSFIHGHLAGCSESSTAPPQNGSNEESPPLIFLHCSQFVSEDVE